MTRDELLKRVAATPGVCGGKPRIQGTRIYIAVILDALAEGLTPQQVCVEYPSLSEDDVRAAIAYAAELAMENIWKVSA